jgi:hypothetical protein
MLRQIIEDDNVSESIDRGCRVTQRLRDAWEGLKWLLARTPEVGKTLGLGDEIRIHKQSGSIIPMLPDITVLYEYDDQTVEIRDVKLTYDN